MGMASVSILAQPLQSRPMTRTSEPIAHPSASTEFSSDLLPRRPQRTPPAPKRPYLDLFLISFLILFFELACIRWFGSAVVFLTFFTNIVLLACFLGMSVGLMTAGRMQNYIRWVLPLTFLSVSLAMISFNLYINHFDKIAISVGGQTKSPQLIYFGTEYVPKDATKLRYIPLWAVAGVFFTLVSMMFLGLGQAMGRAFDAIPNRVMAYTVDVLGSLTGIAIFAADELSPALAAHLVRADRADPALPDRQAHLLPDFRGHRHRLHDRRSTPTARGRKGSRPSGRPTTRSPTPPRAATSTRTTSHTSRW